MKVDIKIESYMLEKLIELGVRAEVISYILNIDIEKIQELIGQSHISVHAILNKLKTHIEDTTQVESSTHPLNSIGLDFITREIDKLHLHFDSFN